MREDLTKSLAHALHPRVSGARIVVFCSQQVDVPAWRRLLRIADAEEVLVLAFDGPDLAALVRTASNRSAAQLVADRHALLATLADDSPLARLVDPFDPARRAWLLVTDPLDPPVLGCRPRLGSKHPSWAMFEHKSVGDTLWDVIGLARADSVVFDRPGTLVQLDALSSTDIVVAYQRRGAAPSAGGGDVRRLTIGPVGLPGGPLRVRAMPALVLCDAGCVMSGWSLILV